jgi:hypothetical protein
MSIALPSTPAPTTAVPRLLDFGILVTPPMGGPAQRVNRIGNRFAVDFTMPTLRAPNDRVFVSRLLRGLSEGILIPFPQAIDEGAPGAPAVDGAAQQGSTIKLKGFAVGYAVREGQFFSIIFGGRRYLHSATGDAAADGSGRMTLGIAPMLRVSPNDGATCEVAQPMIEGFLSGNAQEWTFRTDRLTDVGFTVTEAA